MSRRRPSRALLLGVVAGLAVAGCSERREGERRFRYAAAVEVPAAVDERAELAAVFAGFAQRNGLAFHDTSPRAQRLSNGRQTLAMQLQRTLTNGQPWAEIEISAVGNAAARVTFAAPLDDGIAADSAEGRAELVGALRRRWPGTVQVPVLPGGGIPRQADLRHTPAGLRIDPASAARYGLAADSPLLEK